MKREINRFFLILSLGAVALSTIVGCKKDEEELALPNLGGVISFVADSYVKPGAELHLTPHGVKHPEGKPVGYIWDFSWKSQSDTTKQLTDGPGVLGDITFTMPREIGTYTIKCSAFADDYNGIYGSKEIVVVKDDLNASLTGTGIRPSNPHFTDPRDGRIYYTAQIGDLIWMRHNLAYTGLGKSYIDSPAMAGIFGQFYLWEEAKSACPEGWRLPDGDDWVNLANAVSGRDDNSATEDWKGIAGSLMADAYFHESKMWEYWPDVKITNASQFSAISAGYAIDGEQTTFKARTYAAFWTADNFPDGRAVYRYINASQPDVYMGLADKTSFRASVRCVRDAK